MSSDRSPAPDEATLREDLVRGDFLAGELRGEWGLVAIAWPYVFVWLAAAQRLNAPGKYHLRLECSGYPACGPTGTLWDEEKGIPLAAALWPKGRARVTHVFRPTWENGVSLYHPF
jgi:hypothetical protein